jgi:hypothetical protein
MKKNFLLLALVFAFSLVLSSCKKDNDPAPPPVIGKWNLDQILLSGFPSPYQSLNNRGIEPNVFGLNYTFTVNADKKFTYRFSDGALISQGTGTWEYSGTNLTLNYEDGDSETYTYDQTKQQLSDSPSAVTLPLQNPNTGANENVRGQASSIYKKQQ